MAVTNTSVAPVTALPSLEEVDAVELTCCPYFELELLQSDGAALKGATGRLSFHAIYVTEGEARLETGEVELTLGRFDTVIVPANCERYTMGGQFRALRSSVPEAV